METRIVVGTDGVVTVYCHQPSVPCSPPASPSSSALQALAELEHVSQLSAGAPDETVVGLQVGFLRPRLAAIRAALTA